MGPFKQHNVNHKPQQFVISRVSLPVLFLTQLLIWLDKYKSGSMHWQWNVSFFPPTLSLADDENEWCMSIDNECPIAHKGCMWPEPAWQSGTQNCKIFLPENKWRNELVFFGLRIFVQKLSRRVHTVLRKPHIEGILSFRDREVIFLAGLNPALS